MEIIVPNSISPIEFKIEKMWDIETDESISYVNPGKAGQCVKIHIPQECLDGWIIRRKKKCSVEQM